MLFKGLRAGETNATEGALVVPCSLVGVFHVPAEVVVGDACVADGAENSAAIGPDADVGLGENLNKYV
jgi:hypothetical protein